jgi:hypothetical protein
LWVLSPYATVLGLLMYGKLLVIAGEIGSFRFPGDGVQGLVEQSKGLCFLILSNSVGLCESALLSLLKALAISSLPLRNFIDFFKSLA